MREGLAEHFQATECFTAVFQRYSKTPEGSNVVCLRQVHIDGKLVTDHVWIHRSKHIKNMELIEGDLVQFEARVTRYAAGIPRPHVDAVQFDFCLEKIRNFVVLKRTERILE